MRAARDAVPLGEEDGLPQGGGVARVEAAGDVGCVDAGRGASGASEARGARAREGGEGEGGKVQGYEADG